jgi:hypothetical protein
MLQILKNNVIIWKTAFVEFWDGFWKQKYMLLLLSLKKTFNDFGTVFGYIKKMYQAKLCYFSMSIDRMVICLSPLIKKSFWILSCQSLAEKWVTTA